MVLDVGLLKCNVFIKRLLAKMRMQRWINGNTKKTKIQNEEIHLNIEAAPI